MTDSSEAAQPRQRARIPRRRLAVALDPRVERSRERILQAALEELGEVGYGAFAIESVALRAQVGKATIYRHWSGKLALIADAFETLHRQLRPDIESGSPRQRLERILRHVAEILVDSTFSACIPALIDGAERNRELRQFHYRFQGQARRPLIELIAAGVKTGDFPARVNAELAAIALLGAVFFSRLMSSKPFDPERIGELIETVVGPARR